LQLDILNIEVSVRLLVGTPQMTTKRYPCSLIISKGHLCKVQTARFSK